MHLRTIAAGIVCGLLAAACAGSSPPESNGSAEPDGAYAADLRRARSGARSDLERAVLEDLVIERFEYEQAIDAYITCMTTSGIDVGTNDQGGYYSFVAPGILDDDADARCREGTIDLIEPIFVGLVRNPNKQDFAELRTGCLKRRGVVDDSYTVEQFGSDARSSFVTAPFDPEDPDFLACLSNPSG